MWNHAAGAVIVNPTEGGGDAFLAGVREAGYWFGKLFAPRSRLRAHLAGGGGRYGAIAYNLRSCHACFDSIMPQRYKKFSDFLAEGQFSGFGMRLVLV